MFYALINVSACAERQNCGIYISATILSWIGENEIPHIDPEKETSSRSQRRVCIIAVAIRPSPGEGADPVRCLRDLTWLDRCRSMSDQCRASVADAGSTLIRL